MNHLKEKETAFDRTIRELQQMAKDLDREEALLDKHKHYPLTSAMINENSKLLKLKNSVMTKEKSKLTLEQKVAISSQFLTLNTTGGQVLILDTDESNEWPNVGDYASLDGEDAEDGEYELQSGGTITIADSVVVEVALPDAPAMSVARMVKAFRNRHSRKNKKSDL